MRRKTQVFEGARLQHELKRRYTPRRAKRAQDFEGERRAKRVTLYAFYVDLGLTIEEARPLVDSAT